jgi:hypothetical protein
MLIRETCGGKEGDTFFTQRHGSEDDFEVSLCSRWTEVVVHGDGDDGLVDGLGLSGGHLGCAVTSWYSSGKICREEEDKGKI